MKVGFTGTREGMTHQQARAVSAFLEVGGATEFHHGDCVGADADAHALALLAGVPVVLHPPTEPKARAFCKDAVMVWPEAPYITRNHQIVDVCDVLIAAPAQAQEVLRSGTWATVRYARKQGVRVVVVPPQGAAGMKEEGVD